MIIRITKESDRQNVVDYILRFDLFDKQWLVDIKPIMQKRTLKQNRLYRLWLSVIADETGNDEDFLHDLFRGMFLPRKRQKLKGIKTVIKRIVLTSTKSLDTKQMYYYMEKIRLWTIENLSNDPDKLFRLPDPDDLHIEELIDRYEGRAW